MIITQIIGGLGNQMFQYAAGRALSLKSDTTLALDISGFESYGLHQGFELQHVFNPPFKTAVAADIRNVLGWQSPAIIRRVLARRPFSSVCTGRFVSEPHFQYWAGIDSAPRDCYLSGYWQSERYFSEIAMQLRSDFTFQEPMSSSNSELASQIGSVNSVSLHVRRGDYVNNAKTLATHGVCSLEYYQAAFRYISERVEAPTFFIFSDDIGWAKENLNIEFPFEYVDHNKGAESYNDMRLMSLCKHHIIANSSFSWWGAWLNSSTTKIVIAPQKWFANQTDTRDLFPAGWLAL